MSEQLLHRADIRPAPQEMRRERMPQRVRRDLLIERGPLPSLAQSRRKHAVVQMMSSDFAAPRIHRQLHRREQVLPAELLSRVGIFAAERVWQPHTTKAFRQIACVQLPDNLNLPPQAIPRRFGKHRDAVLFPFPVADDELRLIETHVFHTQSLTLQHPQSGPIQNLSHQQVATAEF
jgi:hypothetical protein